MKQYPSIPDVGDESTPEFEGHLWLLEHVEGSPLRFQLQESGAIQFGSERRVFDDVDAAPPQCRRGIRYVRERLDRETLRHAVDDVSDLTFVGRATHRGRIDYDWERLPPFLGLDVWSADASAFRPPEAAQGIFDQLGLDSANAVERELHSRDFDPERYTIPESAWYDGPAAGIQLRDKRGGRARLPNREIPDSGDPIDADDAESLAAAVATERRFERVAERLHDRGWGLSVDLLQERVLDDIYREEDGRLFAGQRDVDEAAFRTAVATRAQRFLQE